MDTSIVKFKHPPQINWIIPFIKPFNVIQYISGIYFLCKDDEVIYIGSSTNIFARIGSHLKDKWFNSAYFICTNNWKTEYMEQLESYLILQCQPPLNKASKEKEENKGIYISEKYVTKDLKDIPDPTREITFGSPSIPIIAKNLLDQLMKSAENQIKKYQKEQLAKIDVECMRLKEEAKDILIRAEQYEKSIFPQFLRKKIEVLSHENIQINHEITKLKALQSDMYGSFAA